MSPRPYIELPLDARREFANCMAPALIIWHVSHRTIEIRIPSTSSALRSALRSELRSVSLPDSVSAGQIRKIVYP